MDNEPAPRITRREFLKFSLLAGVAGVKLAHDLKRAFSDAIWASVRSPVVTDGLCAMADKVAESRVEENPDFKPIVKILEEGIEMYEGKTKSDVTFKREPDYRDSRYYADGLRLEMDRSLLPRTPNGLVQELRDLAPGEARSAISEAASRQQIEDLMLSGSGFYDRFKSTNTDLFCDEKVIDYTKYFERVRGDCQREITELKKFIDERQQTSGEPISTSNILSFYLELNRGNIGFAITDTYVALKYLTRVEDDDNNKWFVVHIKDEFHGPNFNLLSPGKDRENLVGKAYHSWAFVHLLRYFPVEVVRLGGLTQQLLTFKEQGVDKTVSDVKTLSDLRETEKMLLSYDS